MVIQLKLNSFHQLLKWSLPHPTFRLNVTFNPSFPRSLVQSRKLFLQGGGGKAISAQCSTAPLWLCLPFLPLKVGHYARLLKSVSNACRLLEPNKKTLKVKESAP